MTQPQLSSLKANLEYTNLERKRLDAASKGKTFKTDGSEESQTQNDLYQSSVSDLKNQLQANWQKLGD